MPAVSQRSVHASHVSEDLVDSPFTAPKTGVLFNPTVKVNTVKTSNLQGAFTSQTSPNATYGLSTARNVRSIDTEALKLPSI